MNCVEIKNLTKTFEDAVAIDNIDLSFEKGKIIALLGADGAGKTTLLRLIAGLLCANNGSILTLNLNPKKDKQKISKLIGYMPQKFGLYEDLTVQENLELYANLKGLSEEEKEEYRAARRDRAEKHKKHDAEYGSYNIEEMKGVLTVVFKSESDKRAFMASHGWPEEKKAVSFDDLKDMMSGEL